VNLAQAIWIQEEFPVEAEFVNTNQAFYDAEVSNLDFGKTKAVDVINTWAKTHTNGKIDKFIDHLDPNTVLFLQIPFILRAFGNLNLIRKIPGSQTFI